MVYMSCSAVLWKGTVQIHNHLQNIWPDLSGIGQKIQHYKSFHFFFSVFLMKVRNAFCTRHLLNLCTDLLVPSWLVCKFDLVMFGMEIFSNVHVGTASVLDHFLSHFGGLLLCWTYILYFLFWAGIAIFYGYGWNSRHRSDRIMSFQEESKFCLPPVCIRPSLLGVNVKPSSGKGQIKDFWCFASSFRWRGWQICCRRVVYPMVDVEVWNFLKMRRAILRECNFCWQLTWWQTWIWFMLLGMYNVVDRIKDSLGSLSVLDRLRFFGTLTYGHYLLFFLLF